jgi:xanthine dehydrogenase accessory factor
MTKEGKAYGTVGGGKLEALVETISKETFKSKESKIHYFSLTPADQKGIDMRCGGDAQVSIEYVDHLNPVNFEEDLDLQSIAYIYGAGHVGKEITKIAGYVGFSTVILDDRPEFANRDRFPEADKIIVLENFQNAFKNYNREESNYIIIVTRGHSGDYDVLKQALAQDCEYIGMIGSRKKIAVVYEQLKADGFKEEDLAKVHAPIGLDILAETPEEIAISVIAEMIKVRAELSRIV